jgi:hypothetical protein
LKTFAILLNYNYAVYTNVMGIMPGWGSEFFNDRVQYSIQYYYITLLSNKLNRIHVLDILKNNYAQKVEDLNIYVPKM